LTGLNLQFNIQPGLQCTPSEAQSTLQGSWTSFTLVATDI